MNKEVWILIGGIWDDQSPIGVFSSVEAAQGAANADEWSHTYPDRWESQDNMTPGETETIYGPFKLDVLEVEPSVDPRARTWP